MNAEIKRLQAVVSSKKLSGDLVGALKARQELETIHDSIGIDSQLRIQNLNQLAILSVQIGDQSEAERSSGKSVFLSRDSSAETKANCFMLRACVLAEFGKFEVAVDFAVQAIVIFESVYGPDNDFVLDRKNDLKRIREKRRVSFLDL